MSSPINTVWVDTLVAQIDAVPDCQTMQQAIDQVNAMIAAQLAALAAQLLQLAEMLIAPTNLAQVVAYLAKQVAIYLALYNQVLATQAALLLAQARINQAINRKIRQLNCTIEIQL